ncbi:hypothetical protein BX286_3353 [Streptomyces sp. 3211.6]|uniref:hypothetical protein n=1 Tax=Streptomyces TaxID=1883 RepID=UPI000CC5FA4B|nr:MULTISPECIES: hypothetical protein [Streptomyces]RKT05357.1 hypothetical protein BX286_3353 [Streptomyces sp. 3211.6]RPF41277.1 hypothetical protein EDD96_5074 [Streptomyces sp. Ag109_G2-6]
MYGFLTAAAPEPEVVARVLAETFRVPLQSVDVSPASEMDDRNWDATVTCDYELLPGDLPGQLSVYGAEEVPDQPAEEDLAAALARALATPVLVSWGRAPSIHRVVTPEGLTTFARVEELEGEEAGCTVSTTQVAVAGFPHAVVAGLPEVARELPVSTPVADALLPDADRHSPAGEARTLVWLWEALISRMATGWPPAGWYGADMYREDLENRDRLSAVIEGLVADERASVVVAVESLDAAFREHTAEDGGRALAGALEKDAGDFASAAWYWHRRPATLPWS